MQDTYRDIAILEQPTSSSSSAIRAPRSRPCAPPGPKLPLRLIGKNALDVCEVLPDEEDRVTPIAADRN